MSVLALIVGGLGVSVLLSRLANGDRFLTAVLLVSYALRVGLAISLYAISAYHLPVLQELQVEGGFWRFTQDAPWYHWNALRIAESLGSGAEIPPLTVYGEIFRVDPTFYILIAFVYLALGAHPLHIPILNAMLWSAISVFAYLLAYRLKGEDSGRLAAVLVSAWPSAYVWSSQVLKDTLAIFLLLSMLLLCIVMLEERRLFWLGAAVLLVPVTMLLTRLRFYLIPIVVLALGAAVVCALCSSSIDRRWGKAVRGLILTGILLASFVLAKSIDPVLLLSPSRAGSQGPSTSVPATSDSSEVMGTEAELSLKRVRDVISWTFSPGRIAVVRRGFGSERGASSVGDEIQFHRFSDMIRFLPRGLAYALFAPFPWEWFSTSGDTGILRPVSGLEVLLLFSMAPFFVIGVARAARSRSPTAWLLLGFTAVAAILLGMAVTNVGILFRLRLQFLIPLLVILAAYGGSERWRAICDLFHKIPRWADLGSIPRIRPKRPWRVG